MEDLARLSLLGLFVGGSIAATAVWLFFRDVKVEGKR